MSAAQKKPQFPRIPRFIPEKIFTEKSLQLFLFVTVSFFSAVLLVAIVWQSRILMNNLALSKQVAKERQNVVWETAYWKSVVDTNIAYRDIYHRIALLEYKLGNKNEARKYIKKALEQDPNFEEARVLGAKVGL